MVTNVRLISAEEMGGVRLADKNAQSRQDAAPAVFGRRLSLNDNASQLIDYLRPAILGVISDSTFNLSPLVDERGSRVTHWLGHITTAPWLFNEFELISGPTTVVQWPSHGAVDRTGALLDTLALEQNAIGFDPMAGAILGRIFDHGHATCQNLADWLESPEEWIAFSRLQRTRLLYDSGTEFTVSPAGRRLIRRLLSEGDEE